MRPNSRLLGFCFNVDILVQSVLKSLGIHLSDIHRVRRENQLARSEPPSHRELSKEDKKVHLMAHDKIPRPNTVWGERQTEQLVRLPTSIEIPLKEIQKKRT